MLLALGLLLRRAFGLPWALGTLAFLAIEPNIAAHMPVVMTDLPVALTLGLATLCCGVLAATWRWQWAVAAGLAVGLALGSKHSAVAGLAGLALMLLVAAALAWRSSTPGAGRRATLQAITVAVLGLGTLWAMYGGHFHADANGGDHFNRSMQDKVADLQIPAWRTLIGTADSLHVAPRSYLWGLADTVRAGVEGRGLSSTMLWGTKYLGSPPWFTWPSIIAGKLPLALLAMSLLGLLALRWLKLSATARWSLAMLAAMALWAPARIGAITRHLWRDSPCAAPGGRTGDCRGRCRGIGVADPQPLAAGRKRRPAGSCAGDHHRRAARVGIPEHAGWGHPGCLAAVLQ